MNIFFTGTSFLPQKKSFWPHTIQKKNTLNFSEFGNIIPSLSTINEYDFSIIVVFFKDIVQHNYKLFLSSLIEEIEIKVKNNPKNICLAFSGYNNVSALTSGQTRPDYIEIINNFVSDYYKLIKNYSNLYYLDLDLVFVKHGYQKIFDNRNWYHAHMRLSFFGLKVLDESIGMFIERINNPIKKVLVLDCDNTLWGGVIGETSPEELLIGTDGIGKAYEDFQKNIIQLSNKGIILALSSKNNHEDILNVFKIRKDMPLNLDDITISKINWVEKSLNISDIANELDLSLKSFVFWDDNPIEREKIKLSLPEVTVIDPPEDISLWPDIISESFYFSNFFISDEDLQKKVQYKNRAKFIDRKNKSLNYESFLKKINIKIELIPLDKSKILRASQMTMKTTQFNFRTVTQTPVELENIIHDPLHIINICSVKDDFGDHGIVGLYSIKFNNEKEPFLSNFLFSCRVLGRDVELWLFQNILNTLKKRNIPYLFLEYCPTDRNKLIKNFLEKLPIEKFPNLQSKFERELKNGNYYKIKTNASIVDVDKMYRGEK